MTGEDDERRSGLTGTVLAHAEAVRAQLARITALRAASPDIATPTPGFNPLDLGVLDPLTPGAFPGIGPAPTATTDSEPVAGQSTAAPATSETAQPAEPEPEPKTLPELLAELDALTGLTEVKAEIHRQVAVLRGGWGGGWPRSRSPPVEACPNFSCKNRPWAISASASTRTTASKILSMVAPSRSSWSISSINDVLPFSIGRESAHRRGSRV